MNHLFFPSPQVLRYSQSTLYNNILKLMIESTKDEEVVQYKNITFKIKTLTSILKNSIPIAKENNDYQTADQNEKLLENLPEFREKWLNEYDVAMKKRESMQGNSNNLYLSYKGCHMQEILASAKKERDSRRLKAQYSSLIFPEKSVTSVHNNPLYEESSSKSAVKSYNIFSFFNRKLKTTVSHNPLFDSTLSV
ncbi:MULTISPECIES: hypothetical protein [unclassified Legionella]|uniref:hypothetical protein n=1 Tax=unclassified Legionella TaxID=2622702 RepID=UPI001054C022|nr:MULTISPECIES: hypothetical protein [unclassified Legionella]MDI9817801.1 hypothetical protein [Legionella sp. PL877]